jgi:uncharacterized iron-regulated protein
MLFAPFTGNGMRKSVLLLASFVVIGSHSLLFGQESPWRTASQNCELLHYLQSHRKTPEEYVVSKFADHDIVLLGEEHYIKENLKFVQRLIPRLYQAGVYNLGIEFVAQEYQGQVDKLVTSSTFDENLARELMFNWFVIWGYKDYEDLYRAVWRFNHSLPKRARTFRIVNLSYRPNWSALQGPRTREVMDKVWVKGDPDDYMA